MLTVSQSIGCPPFSRKSLSEAPDAIKLQGMLDPADNLTLPLPVTAPTRLRFVSPTRIYIALLTVDLLGDWIVTQAWCGRDSNRGGGRTTVVASEEKGLALLEAIAKRRRQRGYQLQGKEA